MMNNNPLMMINQLKQNPIQFMMQRGMNIPQNIGNDPNKIIEHLMRSGQVSQEQYNNAVRMAQTFKR